MRARNEPLAVRTSAGTHHGSSRARLAAAAAVVVHAAALALVARWPVGRAPQRAASASADAIEISVESAAVETRSAAGQEPVGRAPRGGASAPHAEIAAAAERGGGSPAPRDDEAATVSTPGAAPNASAEPHDSIMLFAPPAVVAAPGQNPLLGAAARDTSTPNDRAKRRVERSLSDGAHDAAIGLGPEGPVLRALHDATRASLAPERGRATFVAAVDAAGLVVSLRLVGSTGDAAGWNDAREHAARALEGTRLTLRGAKGAVLTIEVDSDVRLPSGARAPVTPALEESITVLPQNAPSHGTSDVVHTYTLGRFDLADIGSKPRRVVHARLVSIGAL